MPHQTDFLTRLFAIMLVFTVLDHHLKYKTPKPRQIKNELWGPPSQDISVKSFRIQVSNRVLEDLEIRLNLTSSFTPSIAGSRQNYGINTKFLKKFLHFWKNEYNWHYRQQYLNNMPQFTTNIQGLEIHFIHLKPPKTFKGRVIPLLMLHSVGGSIREFYEVIPLLSAPKIKINFRFEIIAPSLPGFVFSQATNKSGLGMQQMAEIFNNLMLRLNLKKYYVHGGDWSGFIATIMAGLFPNNVIGMHSTMCVANTQLVSIKLRLGRYFPWFFIDHMHRDKLYPLENYFKGLEMELGLLHLQASKPDTLGIALKDSPMGLAAYLLEKFSMWADPIWKNEIDGGLTKMYSLTQLLDNIMLYWITQSISTSMRFYSEVSSEELYTDNLLVTVPAACAAFKNEFVYFPDYLLKDKFVKLIQLNEYKVGGHFAAMEYPEILSFDIWSAVKRIETVRKIKKKYKL